MATFDVVVIGGGPAGLLLASLLSPQAQTVLLERGALGESSKFWVTTPRRLALHGLDHTILHRAGSIRVGTFLGASATARGEVAVVNEHLVLDELIRRCRASGVTCRDHCEAVALAWRGGDVVVETRTERIVARLLVDASGGFSPVASTFRLHRLLGFFSVFGAHVRGATLMTQDVVMGQVLRFGNPPPVFEVVPTGTSSAYCALFLAGRRLTDPVALRDSFFDHLRANPFISLGPDQGIPDTKLGAIPIGRLRRLRLPGVVAFGEALLIQPPLMGTAFNDTLEYAGLIARQVLTLLDRSAPLRRPRILLPARKRAMDRLQLRLARHFLAADVRTLDVLVRRFAALSPDRLYRFFSNDLRLGDVFASAAFLLPGTVRRQPTGR